MASMTVPQPLTGAEIRKGIPARVASHIEPEFAEAVKRAIFHGLGKTCSLEDSTCYSKFKASWKVAYWVENGELFVSWWVDCDLDDYGRVTKIAIGEVGAAPPKAIRHEGTIDEMPPDKFRRETEQPIPKPDELKKPEPPEMGLSKAMRGPGRRRSL